ncbi:MAG TPA: cation diffusion facilitator family transporter [Bacteroidales bacterium]|jgi:cation diffusion facilitator family transporter|nr:cation diffusion facilitator family transporter [Bacteroidales bacterium]
MAIREEIIKNASWTSIIGNSFLSVLKIVAGFISGSLAVVADGVDSASDIITSIITLVTAKILTRPPNVKYPYGYEKADTIATKVLSFVMFFAGAQLFITTVKKLIHGTHTEMPAMLAIYITVISIIGKLILSWHQTNIGKKTGSNMLIANGKNMLNDVIISASVLIGLIGIYVLKMPVLDTIFALAVSIWVLWVAFNIFREASLELMDGVKDCTIYDQIFNAIDSVNGAHHPHRVRARNIGHQLMIAIDLEVDGDLTLRQAHEIAHKVDEAIKSKIQNVFDVVIHIEPLGDHIEEKAFGIEKNNL